MNQTPLILPKIVALGDYNGPLLLSNHASVDLDGTQINTEDRHRFYQRAAIEYYANRRLHEQEWNELNGCFGGQEILAYRNVLRIIACNDAFGPRFRKAISCVSPEQLVSKKAEMFEAYLDECVANNDPGEFLLIPGYLALATALRDLGVNCVTCTNSPRAAVEQLQSLFGLSQFFFGNVTCDDIEPGFGKPHKGPYRKCAEMHRERLPGVCFENTASGALSAWLAGGFVYLIGTDSEIEVELRRLQLMIDERRNFPADPGKMAARDYNSIVFLPGPSWQPLVDRLKIECPTSSQSTQIKG